MTSATFIKEVSLYKSLVNYGQETVKVKIKG